MYLFQVYSKVVRKSCTCQNGTSAASSTLLAPYIIITILTVFLMI